VVDYGSSGYGPPPGYSPGQYQYQPPPAYSQPGLAIAVIVLLGLSALLGLVPSLALLLAVVLLATVVVFLVWFHQARRNAGWSDWRQSLGPAWAIWGWFIPIVFLWFPLVVMLGIWRASQPAAERTRAAILPAAWWACWLLAWFTGYRHAVYTSTGPGGQSTTSFYSLFFDGTFASRIFAAAAAVLLAVIVWLVARSPVGSGQAARRPYPG
jgi:Domain of unknown function (DUF4328)